MKQGLQDPPLLQSCRHVCNSLPMAQMSFYVLFHAKTSRCGFPLLMLIRVYLIAGTFGAFWGRTTDGILPAMHTAAVRNISSGNPCWAQTSGHWQPEARQLFTPAYPRSRVCKSDE